MLTYAAVVATITTLAVPSVALAAASQATETATGPATVLVAVAGLVTALAAAIKSLRSDRKATAAVQSATVSEQRATVAETRAVAAEDRSAKALAWADRHANAMRDGVVCVVTYPGVTSPCVDVLRVRGWQVRVCAVMAEELAAGALLPGSTTRGDIAVADAVVIEGLGVDQIATLAKDREFRDSIRSGASIVLATGGENHRYDLRPWGVFAVATNTALTTEAAVVASLARRADIAALQGVRPGQLAAARAELVGAVS